MQADGGELTITITKTITFNGGCVVSASGRGGNANYVNARELTSVDYLFHTDGHGGMSASERGGYCLSSELRRYLDGGPQADCFGERELP